MPTAAKLIAAVIFAIGGFLVADSVRPNLPEGQPTPWLVQISMLVPMICAWRVLGRLVGKSYAVAINSGIYAVVVSLFFVLLVFSISEMIKRSMRLQYDGPVEAVTNMFGIIFDYGLLLVGVNSLSIMAGMAVIGGLAAEWAHRRFE